MAGRLQCNASIVEPAIDSVVIRAKSALQTIYVQRISYTPLEFSPFTVLQFTDSLTGRGFGQISVLPLAVGQTTQYIIDFTAGMAVGAPLSKGANLLLKILSGGMTGRLDIKAYQIPLYIVSAYVAPSTAGKTA